MQTYEIIEMSFDKESPYWTDSRECNLMYIRAVEGQLIGEVKLKGWMSLNDAFDRLGFPRTISGQKYGWKDDTLMGDLFDVYQTADDNPNLIIDFKRLTELF